LQPTGGPIQFVFGHRWRAEIPSYVGSDDGERPGSGPRTLSKGDCLTLSLTLSL
jgi:hypothetical protein